MPTIDYTVTDKTGERVEIEITLPDGSVVEHVVPAENITQDPDHGPQTALENVVKRIAKLEMYSGDNSNIPDQGQVDVSTGNNPN